MKKRRIVYNKLPHQELFHKSTKPKVYLSGGYASGKTWALCMKMIQLMSVNYGMTGGLLAPDLKMVKRDVIPTLEDICDANGIRFEFNRQDSFLYFPGFDAKVLIFHAQDEGKSIRGPNIAWGVINEVELVDEPSFLAFLARIRVKKAKLRQLAMSGTPESFSWAYTYFEENPREDTDLIYGRSSDNIYIAEDYIQMLRDSYDPLMQQQYIDGKRVNLSGNRALYAFDRRLHVKSNVEREAGLPIWVSLDFNIYPMAATLWNRMPPSSPYLVQAFDEICLNSSNTDELCRVLQERIPIEEWGNISIYPDPAGAAGSTKSQGRSDIDIIKAYGFLDHQIKYKRSIQSVRDCLNAANALLSKNRIAVSNKCKNFIADAEQCIIKEGGFEIDKKDPKRTHWLDGFKNMIDYEFPIRISSAGAMTVRVR